MGPTVPLAHVLPGAAAAAAAAAAAVAAALIRRMAYTGAR
jgi:hypothetical protein